MSTRNISCVGLTTLPPLCADVLEIWEPHPPGTLRLCPGLQWNCFTCAISTVQMKAAKFANNINESGWETLAQRWLIARICALFEAYSGRRAWKATENKLLKPCPSSRGNHNRKIRSRKRRTDVCKHFFVKRSIKIWNQVPASLLASFSCKLNTFRQRVKNVVTSKEIQTEIEGK
jgi:hypothetical protein